MASVVAHPVRPRIFAEQQLEPPLQLSTAKLEPYDASDIQRVGDQIRLAHAADESNPKAAEGLAFIHKLIAHQAEQAEEAEAGKRAPVTIRAAAPRRGRAGRLGDLEDAGVAAGPAAFGPNMNTGPEVSGLLLLAAPADGCIASGTPPHSSVPSVALPGRCSCCSLPRASG